MKRINEAGNKYGWLTVMEKAESTNTGVAKWLCRCDCGNETVVRGDSLRSGNTTSCGCRQKEITKARNWKGGRSRTPEGYIKIWQPAHPRATKRDGYVLEHILVMETMLGHGLPEGSVVHHCNRNRSDNRPYNLRLFLSNSEHSRYHTMQRCTA